MRILGPVAESNALAQVDPASEITIVASFGLDKNNRSFVPQDLGAQKGDLVIWIYAINSSSTPTRTMYINGVKKYDGLFPYVSPYNDIDSRFAYGSGYRSIGAKVDAIDIDDPTHVLEISDSYSDPVIAGVILRGQRVEWGSDYPKCFSPQLRGYIRGSSVAVGWSDAQPYARTPSGTITNPPTAEALAAGYNGPRIAFNFVGMGLYSSAPPSSFSPPAGWTNLTGRVAPSGAYTSVGIAYRFLPLDGDTSWPLDTWTANQISDNISFTMAVELDAFKQWSRDDQ